MFPDFEVVARNTIFRMFEQSIAHKIYDACLECEVRYFGQGNFTVALLAPIDTTRDYVVGVSKRNSTVRLLDNKGKLKRRGDPPNPITGQSWALRRAIESFAAAEFNAMQSSRKANQILEGIAINMKDRTIVPLTSQDRQNTIPLNP